MSATSPTLVAVLLSAFGTRVHASAVRVLFTFITISDEAHCFLAFNASHPLSSHPLSALLLNPDRYGCVVKRITVTDAGLPPPLEAFEAEEAHGLVMIEEDESDPQTTSKQSRVAVQPMPAWNLNELLAVCLDLEEFVWCSSNPPPDGVCEVLAEHCPRLVNFTFKPDAPMRSVSRTPKTAVSPPSRRPAVPKWDAPSLSLLAALPVTKLHITRLSQQGSRALAVLLSHLGEDSLLEDVNLDFVWLDDLLCQKVVEAGRRIRRFKIDTCGTKLTDKGLISIFEGCDVLEDFGLVEAQGRLSRNLWFLTVSYRVKGVSYSMHNTSTAMLMHASHTC
ncbi:hypothetical protein JB92DRAFT_675532 [Gautieria morchelliformis]|nr:hypothetical protein JB92DRAFT_675532 [Gautieria morchelliformis]